ncbi:MAG: site-specific integrase [Actinomycetota bacterium]|nr:site-specific integrase [Actinomycetota bacterium]
MGVGVPPGSVRLVVPDAVLPLRPEEHLFEAMLTGWRQQQLARNLAEDTIEAQLRLVRRFQAHCGEFPWRSLPAHLEEWTADLQSVHQLAHSTIRSYQLAVRRFLEYLCEPAYGWAMECETGFGSHPTQICFDWNTAQHLADYEGRPSRRALTRRELQDLFDLADDRAVEARRRGRKGWAAAVRDATMLKTAYGWGLRRHELVMLDLQDLGPNPRATEFGDYGVVYVRYGKAMPGSPPKRRSVLRVMPWSAEVLAEWVEEVRPALRGATSRALLWPSERGRRVSQDWLGKQFASVREQLGLPRELTLHCLRHSYVTHLIEDGFYLLFVQHQVGHYVGDRRQVRRVSSIGEGWRLIPAWVTALCSPPRPNVMLI